MLAMATHPAMKWYVLPACLFGLFSVAVFLFRFKAKRSRLPEIAGLVGVGLGLASSGIYFSIARFEPFALDPRWDLAHFAAPLCMLGAVCAFFVSAVGFVLVRVERFARGRGGACYAEDRSELVTSGDGEPK